MTMPIIIIKTTAGISLVLQTCRINLDNLDDMLFPTAPFPEEEGTWKLTRIDKTNKRKKKKITIMTWTVRKPGNKILLFVERKQIK